MVRQQSRLGSSRWVTCSTTNGCGTLVLLRSCSRWRGFGIRRRRLSDRFFAAGWFLGGGGGIIHNVLLRSCLGARIHESDAQLPELGFLGESNSIHAVGNCFP